MYDEKLTHLLDSLYLEDDIHDGDDQLVSKQTDYFQYHLRTIVDSILECYPDKNIPNDALQDFKIDVVAICTDLSFFPDTELLQNAVHRLQQPWDFTVEVIEHIAAQIRIVRKSELEQKLIRIAG